MGQMLPAALDQALATAREQGKVRMHCKLLLVTAVLSNRAYLVPLAGNWMRD